RRAAHDIALYVTASSQRRQEALIDSGYRLLQMLFENAMQLDALAGREAEGSVAIGAGQIVDGKILFGGQPAAGNLATNHEDVVFSRPLFAASPARIAIVLLISPVKFQQLLILIVEMVGVGHQLQGNGAAQLVTGLLDRL